MTPTYHQVGRINDDEVDARARYLAEVSIQDGPIIPTIVPSVWAAPEMPRALAGKVTVSMLDLYNIWWCVRAVVS